MRRKKLQFCSPLMPISLNCTVMHGCALLAACRPRWFIGGKSIISWTLLRARFAELCCTPQNSESYPLKFDKSSYFAAAVLHVFSAASKAQEPVKDERDDEDIVAELPSEILVLQPVVEEQEEEEEEIPGSLINNAILRIYWFLLTVERLFCRYCINYRFSFERQFDSSIGLRGLFQFHKRVTMSSSLMIVDTCTIATSLLLAALATLIPTFSEPVWPWPLTFPCESGGLSYTREGGMLRPSLKFRRVSVLDLWDRTGQTDGRTDGRHCIMQGL